MLNGKHYALLVEDELLVAMVAADALRELGFTVLEAVSATRAFEAAKPDIGNLDLAIIDLGLPDRPGHELVADLLALRPELPIILASGQSTPASEALVKSCKHVAVLPKPYVFKGLCDSIEALGLLKFSP